MNNKIITEETEEKLFQTLREFKAYISFYCENREFDSFKDNIFIEAQENYKKRVWDVAKDIKKKIINIKNFGSGKILECLIQIIEIENNNLVEWHGKHGPKSKEHYELLELKNANKEKIEEFEKNVWIFFTDTYGNEDFFNYFINTINKKYSLIAYLFYIKDRNSFLPIAPKTFDSFFKDNSIDLITSWHCSWENYCEYLEVFKYVKYFLRENLDDDTCLIDAHSFAWIMERQYKYDLENEIYSIPKKIVIDSKNKEVLSKARIGQGFYREQLIKKWNGKSSVNNYSNTDFLIASHIKPWKDCDNEECVDCENGLLLKPDYDKLFDKGLISFKDDGSLIISSELTEEDIKEFNLNTDKIKIKSVSEKMKLYLSYHRKKYRFDNK